MNTNEILKLHDAVIETWNNHDTKGFVALCDDKIVWKDLASAEPFNGKKGAEEFFNNWKTAFPDFKMKTLNKVATENTIAVELEFTGTNKGPLKMGTDTPEIPATNKKATSKGCYFAKVKNGKFIEVNTYPDLAGMMMQLGLIHEMQA